MVTKNAAKCLICEVRPRKEGTLYCHNCGEQIESMHHEEKVKPWRWLVYHDVAVAVFKRHDGSQYGEMSKREPYTDEGKLRLPHAITLDLNTFLEGYTKSEVKRMKAFWASCVNFGLRA